MSVDKLDDSLFTEQAWEAGVLPVVQTAGKYLADILAKASVCSSHGIDHAYDVLNHTLLAIRATAIPEKNFSATEKMLVLLASLLHDADDHKFFPDHQNCENAAAVFTAIVHDHPELVQGKSATEVNQTLELIKKMIGWVSASKNGDTIPHEAVASPWLLYPRHADRLTAIGWTGVFRCYKYTKTSKNPLWLPETTPRPSSMKEMWAIANRDRFDRYDGTSASMIDHYYDKLLQLGNFETENSYFATAAAQRRQPLIDIVMLYAHFANMASGDAAELESVSTIAADAAKSDSTWGIEEVFFARQVPEFMKLDAAPKILQTHTT